MSTPKVIIIFGAGANTGIATAQKFADGGYKVAAVSRHPSEELKKLAHLIVPADLKNPSEIEPVFEKVTKELGPPHVVVYNAADTQLASVTNPLEVSVQRMTETLAVNTLSPYAAAQAAVKRWQALPDDGTVSKTFMFTGNMTNTQLFPGTMSLGIGKNGTAYWLETSAATYAGKFKFYYVDERTPEGESTMILIDGPAHAVEFWRLAEEEKGQKHWCWTFVKGQGYVGNKLLVDRELRNRAIPGLPEGGIAYDQLAKFAASNEELAKTMYGALQGSK